MRQTDREADGQRDKQTDGIAVASTALAIRALRRAVMISNVTFSFDSNKKILCTVILCRRSNRFGHKVVICRGVEIMDEERLVDDTVTKSLLNTCPQPSELTVVCNALVSPHFTRP